MNAIRPQRVSRRALVLALLAAAFFLIARATGSGWIVVLFCGALSLLILAAAAPAAGLAAVRSRPGAQGTPLSDGSPRSEVFALPDGTLRSGVALEAAAVYTVVSRRLPISAALLRSADTPAAPLPTEIAKTYGSAGADDRPGAPAAADVTAGASTTYDKVRALERWMAANTRYTLDIPPCRGGGRD